MLLSVTGIVVAPGARLKVSEAAAPLEMMFDVISLAIQVYDPEVPEQVSGLPPGAGVALTDTTFAPG